MNVKNQCCTLEQAKQLKELGINVKSLFGYIEIPDNGCPVHTYWKDVTHALIDAHTVMFAGNGAYAWYAYNVAELGLMLHMDANGLLPPSLWHIDRNKYFPTHYEAEFRANMLIDFIESGIFTAANINVRSGHGNA